MISRSRARLFGNLGRVGLRSRNRLARELELFLAISHMINFGATMRPSGGRRKVMVKPALTSSILSASCIGDPDAGTIVNRTE